MSHSASPDDPDSLDLFADVSHHGSSLFELFSVNPAFENIRSQLDSPTYPSTPSDSFETPHTSSFSPLSHPTTHQHHLSSIALSNVTVHPANPLTLSPATTIAKPIISATKKSSLSSSSSASKRRKPRPDHNTAPVRRKTRRPSNSPVTPSTSQNLPTLASRPVQLNTAQSPSNQEGHGQVKDAHNSHTRRCREKLNSKFQQLLHVLPTAPPNTDIKHKAKILDYTIQVFYNIQARKTVLEAELALSSQAQLNDWVAKTVHRSRTLQQVLAPFLSLICTKGSWKYSEAWIPTQELLPTTTTLSDPTSITGESQTLDPSTIFVTPNSRLRLGLAVIPSLGNTDDQELHPRLERFRDRSRAYTCKPRVDLPGRIMCTMRPEWLPSLDDQEAFQRSRLARDASLVICFGVPIFIRGHVVAVAVFYDTEQRPYDAKCVDLAIRVSILLGNSLSSASISRSETT